MYKIQYDELKVGDLITMSEKAKSRLQVIKTTLHYIEVKLYEHNALLPTPFINETKFTIGRETYEKIGYYKV